MLWRFFCNLVDVSHIRPLWKYLADIWPSRHHATNLYSGLASLGEIFVKRLSMWCSAFVLPPSSREGVLVNRVVLSQLRHYLLPVVQGFFSQNSQTHIHNINFHCWTISCSHNLSKGMLWNLKESIFLVLKWYWSACQIGINKAYDTKYLRVH